MLQKSAKQQFRASQAHHLKPHLEVIWIPSESEKGTDLYPCLLVWQGGPVRNCWRINLYSWNSRLVKESKPTSILPQSLIVSQPSNLLLNSVSQSEVPKPPPPPPPSSSPPHIQPPPHLTTYTITITTTHTTIILHHHYHTLPHTTSTIPITKNNNYSRCIYKLAPNTNSQPHFGLTELEISSVLILWVNFVYVWVSKPPIRGS